MLDYVMVPTGLAIMVGYHIWLLYRISKRPSTTVIGINAINRRFWVNAMMEVPTYCVSIDIYCALYLFLQINQNVHGMYTGYCSITNNCCNYLSTDKLTQRIYVNT